MKLALRTLAVIAVAALVWLALFETRRLAQVAGKRRVEIRRLESELATARLGAERSGGEVARLEQELEQALGYAHSLGEALTQEAEAREQQAVARAAASAMLTVPPLPGVDRCLQTLRDCLRADGFQGLMPLRASALVDRELRDVEWLDTRGGGSVAEVVVCRSMTATLDRARGALALRFTDGTRRVQGVHSDLPPAGLEIVLQPVFGRMWEDRLPYLLSTVGEYPLSAPEARSGARLDPVTRAHWLDCFDRLLAEAGTDLRLRVAGFAALDGATFQDARLFGYDKGTLLALAADCDQLAIEVDERAGIVSLLLRNGTLRRDGVESTIGADGYRMLLPNVSPRLAADAMLGMVIRR